MNIICFLLLLLPLIWELYNDRNGDAHTTRGLLKRYNIPSKKIDVIVRGGLDITIAFIVNKITNIPFVVCLGVTISNHIMFFDYLIAYILIKKGIIKGHWYSYMGSGEIDSNTIWKNINPHIKLVIRLIIFLTFTYLYFKNQ